jgi:hypothetical protein
MLYRLVRRETRAFLSFSTSKAYNAHKKSERRKTSTSPTRDTRIPVIDVSKAGVKRVVKKVPVIDVSKAGVKRVVKKVPVIDVVEVS